MGKSESILPGPIIISICCALTSTLRAQPTSPSYEFSKGLVAYYPFNGNANDESGSGNDATITRATLTTDRFGNPNRAFGFNGRDSFIQLPLRTGGISGASKLTISAWFRLDSSELNQALLGHWIASATGFGENIGLILYVHGSNGINVSMAAGTGWLASTKIDQGKWHHVVFVFDGAEAFAAERVKVYVDSLKTTLDFSQYANVSSQIGNRAVSTFIGARTEIGGSPIQFFNGAIDDIRFYNRALSGAEISALYQMESPPVPPYNPGLVAYYPFDGNANDGSGNGQHGLVSGAGISFTADRFGLPNNAVSFDGQGAQIELPATLNAAVPTATQAMSVSFWMKRNGLGTVISKYLNGIAPESHFFIQIDPPSAFNVSGTGVDVFRPALAPNDMEWSNYVIVFNNGSGGTKAFQNGQLLGMGTLTFSSSIRSTKILIGKLTGLPSANLTGTIDDLRIYNRILSDDEVRRLYGVESLPQSPAVSPPHKFFITDRLKYSPTQGFRIAVSPLDRSAFRIETSIDLKNWTHLITFPTNSGPFEFVDSSATNFSSRFYRAVVP
jgi:hypothetical protein